MYDAGLIAAKIEQEEQRLGFPLERHTPDECQSIARDFWEIYDRRKHGWIRPLTVDEVRWVQNERALTRCDYLYYATRYAHIVPKESGGLIGYRPNVAQLILNEIRAEHERKGIAMAFLNLKARQLGVSTDTEILIAHRCQFGAHLRAIIGSATPDDTEQMAQMMVVNWEHMAPFLMPLTTASRPGSLIRFGNQNVSISMQWLNQKRGIGRGRTPHICHISEVCECDDPAQKIEAALMNAMHESPGMYQMFESTAGGMGTWFHTKWESAKMNWHRGRSSLRPVFLPWYAGSDLYPNDYWLRSHPIPELWEPHPLTKRHASRANAYVERDTTLRKFLGMGWKMPKEQMWFWENRRDEAIRSKTLNMFYQELCVAGDTLVSTENGIIPIREAAEIKQVETGQVGRWACNGSKPIVEILTKYGRSLRVTEDHKIATTAGWKEARHLTSADVLVLSKPRFASSEVKAVWNIAPCCRSEIRIDARMARFLGYFMGDGCWCRDRVDFACDVKDEDVIEDLANLIQELIGAPPQRKRRGGMILLSSNNIRWREILWNLGALQVRWHPSTASLDRRSSGYKRKVCVPECIRKSPDGIVREFLSAVFECDGHARKKAAATSFFTKYKDFARDIQLLLLGFGINGMIRDAEKINSRGYVYTGNTIHLNAAASDLFHDRIDFIGKRKKAGKRGSGNYRPISPNVMEDVVLSVKPAGESDVYDLTVLETHQFGANGIMVHNCSDDMEAWQLSQTGIFDAEILSVYREHIKEPVGVYGLRGKHDEVPIRHQPTHFEIDADKPPIPIKAPAGQFELVPLRFEGIGNPAEVPDGRIYIWEWAQPNNVYGIGADTGYGVRQDSTSLEVCKKAGFQTPPAFVAELASNTMSATDAVPFTYALHHLYTVRLGEDTQQPLLVIEKAANGQILQQALLKMGCGNFHIEGRYDRYAPVIGDNLKLGVNPNHQFRSAMLETLIKSLRDFAIEINSPWFIREMGTLGIDEHLRKVAAEKGSWDDRIIAAAMVYFSLHIGEAEPPAQAFGLRQIVDPLKDEQKYASYRGQGNDRDWSAEKRLIGQEEEHLVEYFN